MAWNDPPSFDYQQMSNTGRKFKHRYVLSDTKLGHQRPSPISPAHYQQPTLSPMQAHTYQNQGQQPSFYADQNHSQPQPQHQQPQPFQQQAPGDLLPQPTFETPISSYKEHDNMMNMNYKNGTMNNYPLGTAQDNYTGNGFVSSRDQTVQFNQIQPLAPQTSPSYPQPFPSQPQ